MKIFGNIIPGIKAVRSIRFFKAKQKGIHSARAAEDYEAERKYILESTSTWGKNICQTLGIEVEVIGRENLPQEGPVVYVSNHQGYADILVACAALDTVQFGFVAKKELADIPLYGPCIVDIRSVMMNRDDPRESVKAILEGVDLIKKGFSLLIFPEGTRSKGGPVKEFHKGSLKLATKPKVPVVPVSIDGSYRCLEETGKIKGGKVKVTIHEAIPTDSLSRQESADLAKTCEMIIKKDLGQA